MRYVIRLIARYLSGLFFIATILLLNLNIMLVCANDLSANNNSSVIPAYAAKHSGLSSSITNNNSNSVSLPLFNFHADFTHKKLYNVDPVKSISLLAPSTPIVTTTGSLPICGAGSITLTASASTPAGGTYNWYNVSTGGTSLASTASYTPDVYYTITFYVDYTQGGSTSARKAFTVTVTPAVSPVLSGATFMFPFSNLSTLDVSGNLNEALSTAGNQPNGATDRHGNANCAASFNGSNQFLTTLTPFNNPQVFSISLWFNATVAGGVLIGFANTQTGPSTYYDRHIYMDATGRIYWGLYTTVEQTINTSQSYNDGLWHRVVATVSAANGSKLYIDGALKASSTAMTTPFNGGYGYWRIGYNTINGWPNASANEFFTGKLDDIAVYNRELSAAEVAGSSNLNLIGNINVSCQANPVTLTAPTVTGATYSWTDGTTTLTGNPVTFPSPASANQAYSLTMTVGSCSSYATLNMNTQTYSWTGAAGTTNPLTGNNWTYLASNTIQGPSLTSGMESIIIPTAAAGNYPVLTGNASVFNLTVNGSGRLSLGANTLNLGCNIYNNANTTSNGILSGSTTTGTLNWNGSGTFANQNYIGTNTSVPAIVSNMVLNNTATSGNLAIGGGYIDITNTLTIAKGNITVNTPTSGLRPYLTLKSTALLTANVAPIPAAYRIDGLVNTERFITGGGVSTNRGYRILSSPVNQTAALSNINNIFNLSYLNGHTYNGFTYTGVYTGGTGTGFSATTNAPTIYLFDERKVNSNATYTSGKYIGINTITTTGATSGPVTGTVNLSNGSNNVPIPVGNAFQMFFIGPSTRTNSGTATPPADATLTAHGFLNQQNVTVNLWYAPTGGTTGNLSYNPALGSAAGYNQAGNPYACTINLQTVLTDNPGIDNIYVLSSKQNKNQFYIAYTPNGTSAPSSGYAVSGEGFLVHATGSGKTLTFKESEKSVNTQLTGPALILSTPKKGTLALTDKALNTTDALTAPVPTQPLLTGFYMKMSQDTAIYDYCGIYFGQEWSANFQTGDALDLDGASAAVFMSSFSADGKRTAVKHFPDYRKGAKIQLFVSATTDGTYVLSIEDIRNIDTNKYKITLLDHFKNDSLDIGRYKAYKFDIIKADTNTFGAKRFELEIAPLPGSAYKLQTFSAQIVPDGILASWFTNNEGYNYLFTLEKKDPNGNSFSPLYTTQSNAGNTYKYTDRVLFTGENVYRLKQVDEFGEIAYSNPVSVYYDKNKLSILSLYPNAVTDNLNIRINYNALAQAVTGYKLTISSITGFVMLQKGINGDGSTENVSKFRPGVYIVELRDAAGKVIDRAKFIKK